jgi:Flp pilus assembly protein TadB
MNTLDTAQLFRSLESALRAGYSLRQALERVSSDFEDKGLRQTAAAAMAGEPLPTLFDGWARQEVDIALLAGAIRLQLETERNLADTLGVLGAVMSRRPRIDAPA